MQYVVFYTPDPAGFARAAEVFPRHRAYLDEFAGGGQIIGIGNFTQPERHGAMCIFRSHEAAVRFVAADPFVTEGVVTAGEILEWNALSWD